ncbi:hypothetical protein [Tropicibacter naphthalenivorans]|uniref:Putative GTPase n=1 Tax=Tropicibacter naphthalenivorans TaxID=441103 RepID=A0A0P1G1D3_9RHOB|nr:hypothetical protein [Tropicibacter naphthalenivorans]CUH75571.1 putative GTPase [Tropicibacter naphthalenivorans]SMC43587.1 hypothetical protein SAMN04488093_101372 [Tropicibacter naphthalenivorans]
MYKATAIAPAAAPLRVAICGEVRSGKSTVINALLRQSLLSGVTHAPQVVGHAADGGDGLRLDAPHLRGIELIEVPLTKAEDLTDPQRALIKGADVWIWVTIASQAWRFTELTLVEQLAEQRPARGLLVVSRGDKLRRDADRAKIMDRMARETAGIFDGCHMLHGAGPQIAQAASDEAAWQATGGRALYETLQQIAADLDKTPARAASAEIVDLAQRRPAVDPAPEPDPAPERVTEPEPAPVPTPSATSSAAPDPRADQWRAIAADFPAITALVAWPAQGAAQPIMGEDAQCQALSDYLRPVYAALPAHYAGGGVALATASTRLHILPLAEVTLAFAAPAQTLSEGMAATVAKRLAAV